MSMQYPYPPRVFGNVKCTADSRRANKTVKMESAQLGVAAICICNITAYSGTVEGCLKILSAKHRRS